MKHGILTVFTAALILLSACSKAADYREPGMLDKQAVYPMDQASWENYLTTEQAVYHRENNLLTFCPAGDTRFYPLCGKPNCDHTTPDCNAWLDGGNGLGCHRGRLYTVVNSDGYEHMAKLVSLAPNGEDRRDELELEGIRGTDGSIRGATYYRFHENRLIVCFDPDWDAPYEEQRGAIRIVDLETLKVTEPFGELMARHAWVQIDFKAAESCLYANVELPQSDGSTELWMLELNMDTGETRELFPSENVFNWYAQGNTLYFVEDQKCFSEYDLTTGTKRTIPLPVDELRSAVRTDDLIVATGKRSEDRTEMNVYFLDRDYRLLDQLRLTDGLVPCYYGKNRILFINTHGGEDFTPTHYLARSAIGSGMLELQPLGL